MYKGTLVDGTRVAIKRAERGSMQGVVEFKNEIELLSRVHHRNLVSLIGFCYEQGEQMLVYEYVSSGTLRENLLGTWTKPPVHRIYIQHFTEFPSPSSVVIVASVVHSTICVRMHERPPCSERNVPGLEEEAQDRARVSEGTCVPSRARRSAYHPPGRQVHQYPPRRPPQSQGRRLRPLQASVRQREGPRQHASERNTGTPPTGCHFIRHPLQPTNDSESSGDLTLHCFHSKTCRAIWTLSTTCPSS